MKQGGLKRTIIIVISLVLMFGFKWIPAPEGLSTSGMQVLGVFLGVLLLWLTISIDWPSILALGALAFVPELKMGTILSGSFGNATFAFLMFTFMCTYALSKTSFVRRCAIAFITSSFAKKGPWQFVILFFASVIFIGCFISPTVLFVVYLPIVEEIYSVLKLEKGNKVAAMLMMGLVICCGISSGMTPIAHVFPLISMGLFQDATGMAISYASYMGFAIPAGIITFILMLITFKVLLRPNMKDIGNVNVDELKKEDAPVQKNEKMILAIFVMIIALWVLPGLIKPIFPNTVLATVATWIDSFGTAMPPLLGVVALSVLTYEGKPLLNFNEAMSKGVSWPSLIMCASTLALGSAITNADIGLTAYLSSSIAPLIQNLAPLLLVFILTLWAAIQTNVSSNMVTATVVTAIAITLTLAMPDINTAAVCSIIGMMAAYAFATPPAMPCVAIASSSGWTNTIQMMKYGFTVMLIAVIVATAVGYPLASLLMG